ncbi:MAG: SprT-like domain-containing protein [Gammaproteobacteria bacterium]|nr:SprT-like domain-containing protein [Gammaproteobacteria bacterium]
MRALHAGDAMYVKPIDQSQQLQVIAATHACIQQAERLFARDFSKPVIRFDLSGRIAGMYRLLGQQPEIRYNPYLFGKYFDDNLANTVPHEVAHHLVAELYGWRNIRPHGTQWKDVMRRLGAAAAVTCRYDLSGIPQRRQRRFNYSCGCTTHALSAVRHNRMQRGQGRYLCRQCHQTLVFAGDTEIHQQDTATE